jgi:hypothetical protein
MIVSGRRLVFWFKRVRQRSVGVLLQQAQNVQTVAISPWLMPPRCQ